MRWTTSFIPTLREDPADAEAVSHRLMVRAGLVRQLTAGVYVYLPLGQRSIDKVNAIIREEMNAIGGQEITMPVLHPAELWQQSGRWYDIKDEMFRLKDRHGRDMCLGMTHEEVVAWLASKEIRSYRELPQVWYQIQTKERDEARPRSGVLRTREFWMKDAYTLDVDEAALAVAYDRQKEAYVRIFRRAGLTFHVVESDVGMMGGLGAHEFMAPSPAGEDEIARCPSCGYAANVELARSRPTTAALRRRASRGGAPRRGSGPSPTCAPCSGSTRRRRSRACSTWVPPVRCWRWSAATSSSTRRSSPASWAGKSAPRTPTRSATRSARRWARWVRSGRRCRSWPTRLSARATTCAAPTARGCTFAGSAPGRDFTARYADLHVAQPGDSCPECAGPLVVERVIEVGNIFKLGTKYSTTLGATYLDEQGQARPIVMGSYGIGPARIVASAIEQRHDTDGIVWPWSIAPAQIHVLPVNVKQAPMRETAERLYQELGAAGYEAILDDRDDRPGVKFKDADLLGLPIRVTVGARLAKDGMVEVRTRRERQDVAVPPDGVVAAVRDLGRRLTADL